MKKMLIIVITIFVIVMVMLSIWLVNVQSKNKQLQQINAQYEYYTKVPIYGTDLATLINKAIDNNKKYNIPKDANGLYIPDDKYSIKITIHMLSNEENYEMETIFEHDIQQFVELFNSSKFKADKIEYHFNTGRISQINFSQTQE